MVRTGPIRTFKYFTLSFSNGNKATDGFSQSSSSDKSISYVHGCFYSPTERTERRHVKDVYRAVLYRTTRSQICKRQLKQIFSIGFIVAFSHSYVLKQVPLLEFATEEE